MSGTGPAEILTAMILGWILIYMLSRPESVAKALSKRGVEIMLFGVMWRTERGKGLFKRFSESRLAGVYGYLALFYSIGLSLFGLYFLTLNIFRLVFPYTGRVAELKPLIPGVTLQLSVEELAIVMAVIAISVVVHEASHAIVASSRGIGIRSVGLAVFLFFPAGFVELDEEAFLKTSRINRLLTYSAGTFANVLVWALALFALLNASTLLSWGFEPSPSGVLVVRVVEGSPGLKAGLMSGDAIVGLNGTPIGDLASFLGYMSHTKPNQTLYVDVLRDGGTLRLRVLLSRNPANNKTGFIGVQVYDYYRPKLALSPLTPYYFSVFLSWLATISFSIAILNMLPIPMLDGDKIWAELVGSRKGTLNLIRAFSIIVLAVNLMHGVGLI